MWDTGAKRDSSGNSNLTNGVYCSRNTASKSNGPRRSQNPQVESEETNRCCVCASWFGWVQWYYQIHCCGAGCPTSTASGIMRTLQANVDLTDDGDKVIFRQFGGESSLRTLQSGHTVIRADQFDPDGWQLPEITELCQNNVEGCATHYMSVIAHVYQKPICKDNDTPAGDHDPASTRSCRPRQKTTSNDNGPAGFRQFFPLHLVGSRVVNKCTVLFKTMSGIYGRALNATSPGEAQRHGTLWTIKQWKRLAHYMVYVRCAAFFDTLSREFLMLIHMGRSEDIRLALRRRKQREMKDKKSNVANLLEAQWVRGKDLPRGNLGNSVEEGTERLRSSTKCNPEGRQPGDVQRTMRALREQVAAHCLVHGGAGFEDDAKQSHCALVHRETTGRDRTSLASTRATAESPLGMLDVQYNIRAQPGVQRAPSGPGELRGCGREHGS